MKLKLLTIDPVMAEAFRKAFAWDKSVEVIEGPLTDEIAFDTIVSPANSLGIMDGGFDQAIIDVLGPQVQDLVSDMVNVRYGGIQPVGSAEVVKTNNFKHPWLVHAPTMVVPTMLSDFSIAYWSFHAALSAIIAAGRRADHVVLATAMGGGTGGIPPNTCANLMSLVWEYFCTHYQGQPQQGWQLGLQQLGMIKKVILKGERVGHETERLD